MNDELNDELLEPLVSSENQAAVDIFTTLKTTGTTGVIQALQNRELLSVANNDDSVKDKLNANAKDIIETESDTLAKDAKLKNLHANFKMNKFACGIYGVDESCPIWQQRLMKIGAAFWFIIYWLFASITIVPINTFLQMVGNIVKNNFCKWMLTILFYIIILFIAAGTPIILKFLQGA